MPYFNIVAETNENTVVTEYEPVRQRSDAYQSEAALEKEFIRILCEEGYTYLPIHTEEDLIRNVRKQLEELNSYKFSDSEWDRFFNDVIANKNEGIVEKTAKIQEDNIQVLKRDDGMSKNITLIDKKNVHSNILQVINQYEVSTEEGARHDIKTIGMVFVRTLRQMDIGVEGITKFSLNQFSGRYMLHILARFTSYVNVRMGNPSHFEEYVDRKRQGNTYDIEHILPDKYEDYKDSFTDYEDFEETRNQIGNLILLTRDKNRSYQAMNYSDKVQKYAGDNVLAQALNDNAYHNNPKFLEVANEYGMHSIPVFDKTSISDRAEIYMKMASDIWNADDIKKLAGGWSDEEEKQLFKNVKGREFTVGYANRSWADALKYGFLSANLGGSGKSIYNVQVGDTVFCHVAGSGFVGIGECTSTAVSMKNFMVQVDGVPTPISDAPWLSEDSKKQLDPNKEVFRGVTWKKYVTDPADGYWEKGMTSVPLVAYMLSDKTTHDKVREHFGYQDEG